MSAGCAVGPDYRKPTIDIPTSFKEGVEWQRAQADPQATLSSTWWRDYHDDTLTQLVEQALQANQSIAQAEAAYRLAQATVAANTASLFPTISAGISGSRAGTGEGAVAASGGALSPGVHNTVTADAAATWELDLWGQVRREIESSKASAQASDAQLAGQRLSIAASVVSDYFELRQADVDIDLLEQQRRIDAGVLDMTRASYAQGESSNDSVLTAQDTLEVVIADLQSTQTAREQYEHAIAVLTGVPPGKFSIASEPHYAFVAPSVPLSLPSQLLERRYDVVSAERAAASANAKIGAAEAAFFPNLTLSAQGGFQHSALANLFSLPSRYWTLGPQLAGTIFDGGARTAAVHGARATYDEAVAGYRQTVLSAFESVEDSLSSWNHLAQQEHAYADIYQRNKQLFDSEHAQYQIGTTSRQSLFSEQLTLLLAQQNLVDTQASLTLSSVTLIKNLGGGWQWDEANEVPANAAAPSTSSH
ncbi:efflux transporter outer membrane subunit [Paraburkholderia oxyphila]|uniref:efflux transporter outer membrane subunit n=1 Tax=Paraburkholderia oxyphila TaxID=614212 RepID=UPI001FE1D900|nr:efflux transporter outer membrane subunit [Paraburkholderia oxyphila]